MCVKARAEAMLVQLNYSPEQIVGRCKGGAMVLAGLIAFALIVYSVRNGASALPFTDSKSYFPSHVGEGGTISS